MWKAFQESRQFQSINGPVTMQVNGLRREDGFTIVREEQADPEFGNIQVFSVKGHLGATQFAASRYKGGLCTRTYVVLLSAVELTLDPALCCAYSQEIASALLHFSNATSAFFNKKGVLFSAEEV